jgi:hypothetical protein
MSVKSIENGSLTLNNLDVSTINGLPPSSSGVTSAYSNFSAVDYLVSSASAINQPFSNLTLEAGTYLLFSNCNISNTSISSTGTITFQNIAYFIQGLARPLGESFYNLSLPTGEETSFNLNGMFVLTTTDTINSVLNWTNATGYDGTQSFTISSTIIVKLF